jgi:hypothetical protein
LNKLLWKDALSWTIDVTLGYSIDDLNIRVGKGGELIYSKKVERQSFKHAFS